MNRLLRHLPALAIALAVLIPLEQAHCMWMNVTPAAASTCGVAKAPTAPHACCMPKAEAGAARSTAKHAPAPGRAGECPCVQLPPATAPAAMLVPVVPAGLVLALPARAEAPLPAPVVVRTVPRIDTGPAPPSRTPGANGLRAPPLLG